MQVPVDDPGDRHGRLPLAAGTADVGIGTAADEAELAALEEDTAVRGGEALAAVGAIGDHLADRQLAGEGLALGFEINADRQAFELAAAGIAAPILGDQPGKIRRRLNFGRGRLGLLGELASRLWRQRIEGIPGAEDDFFILENLDDSRNREHARAGGNQGFGVFRNLGRRHRRSGKRGEHGDGRPDRNRHRVLSFGGLATRTRHRTFYASLLRLGGLPSAWHLHWPNCQMGAPRSGIGSAFLPRTPRDQP